MPNAPIHQDVDRISTDMYCIECNYNLRTLSRDGRCPECGTPVIETIQEPPAPQFFPFAAYILLAGATCIGCINLSCGFRVWFLNNPRYVNAMLAAGFPAGSEYYFTSGKSTAYNFFVGRFPLVVFLLAAIVLALLFNRSYYKRNKARRVVALVGFGAFCSVLVILAVFVAFLSRSIALFD